jgi:hypothetical protein
MSGNHPRGPYDERSEVAVEALRVRARHAAIGRRDAGPNRGRRDGATLRRNESWLNPALIAHVVYRFGIGGLRTGSSPVTACLPPAGGMQSSR